MLSRVMMKADPPQLLSELELLVVMLGSDPPQPPLRRGELELELELLVVMLGSDPPQPPLRSYAL